MNSPWKVVGNSERKGGLTIGISIGVEVGGGGGGGAVGRGPNQKAFCGRSLTILHQVHSVLVPL